MGKEIFNGLESLSRNWMLSKFSEYDIFDKNIEKVDCTKKATCENGKLYDEFLDSGGRLKVLVYHVVDHNIITM